MEKETHREPIHTEKTYLTNKEAVLSCSHCPLCGQKIREVRAKVEVDTVYWLYQDLFFCEGCHSYFITHSGLQDMLNKAVKIFPKARVPFFIPSNIEIVQSESHEDMFVPKAFLNKNKYNRRNLPPQFDVLYDPSDAEYYWVTQHYLSKPVFRSKPKEASFLTMEGYSANKPDDKRRSILDVCIKKHGKDETLRRLQFNIDMRIRQAGGRDKYAHAISVWRKDILYIDPSYFETEHISYTGLFEKGDIQDE